MPSSLKLLDYSDRELIGVVNDEADAANSGWAATDSIAATLALDHERPNQCVGARLSWLRRYGIVEYRSKGGQAWRLTPIGKVFLNGKLSKLAENALEKMEPGQLFTTVRFLAEQQRSGPEPVGHMLRREWRHGTGR